MIEAKELTSNNINDQLATTYGLKFNKNFTQFIKFLLLKKWTKPNDICLDVGIANGIFTIPLAKGVREVHGVDISQKMLKECRKNLASAGVRNVTVYERSATNLLFDDASFDIVFSYSTLLLVPNPERAYHEIVRVLKPGGIAILDITGKFNLSRIQWTKWYQKQGHFGLNYYSLSQIEEIFGGLGLKIIERHATGFLDQWKYVRGISRLKFLDKIAHGTSQEPDLDYKVSQRLPTLANRWYFVLKK